MEILSFASIDSTTVDDVVISAMGMLVEGEPCAVTTTIPESSNDLIVAVYCDKDQQSAVILRCSQALAESVTSRLLELPPDELNEPDILDATGELVNVIAGNLRGLVSSIGTMTTPFTMDKSTYAQFRFHAHNAYSIMGESMEVLRV